MLVNIARNNIINLPQGAPQGSPLVPLMLLSITANNLRQLVANCEDSFLEKLVCAEKISLKINRDKTTLLFLKVSNSVTLNDFSVFSRSSN